MVGCYQTMQTGNGAWQRNMPELLQPASGLVGWKGSRTTEDWTQTTRLTMLPLNNINASFFDHFYASISKCNKLIEKLAESPVDQTFKNEIEGEAKLIRAIDYFTLVRLYGDVPLMLKSPATAAEGNAHCKGQGIQF